MNNRRVVLKFSKVAFGLIANGENAKQRAVILESYEQSEKVVMTTFLIISVNCFYSQ